MKLPKLFRNKRNAEEEDDDLEALDEIAEDDDREGGRAPGRLRRLLKLSRLFGAKRDADEPEEDSGDAGPSGRGPQPSFEREPDGGDPLDDDDFDDDDEQEDGLGGRRSLVFMAAGGGVLALGILGGLGWWLLSPPDGAPGTGRPVADSDGSGVRVEISLPPAPVDGDAAKPSEAAAAAPTAPPGTLPASALAPPTTNELGPGQGVVVEAVARTAYASLPDQPRPERLKAEPENHLLEQIDGLDKPVPRMAGDQAPRLAYARPSNVAADVPRVAVIVSDIGLSRAAGIGVIGKLPPETTIAVDPYARDLDDWVVRARLFGHEVLLELPMESERFPLEDAGPLALNAGIQSDENISRLRQVMSRTSVYVGLLAVMGSKFNRADGQLRPVLTEIRDRGLLFVDGTEGRSAAPPIAAELDAPQVRVDVVLDDNPTQSAVAREIARLEAVARQNGAAVGLGRPYPSTVQQLAVWAQTLADKGMALVPVSALTDAQPVQ